MKGGAKERRVYRGSHGCGLGSKKRKKKNGIGSKNNNKRIQPTNGDWLLGGVHTGKFPK